MEFIQDWMKLARQAMAGTQWKDPTLAMFALLAKLGPMVPPIGSQAARWRAAGR